MAASPTYRAVLCEGWGPPESLQLREVPCAAPPGRGRITIAVEAASVNFPDVLMIAGKYQFKPKLPFAPQHQHVAGDHQRRAQQHDKRRHLGEDARGVRC